jgi:tetratricopeptide (TPR) repeat protein
MAGFRTGGSSRYQSSWPPPNSGIRLVSTTKEHRRTDTRAGARRLAKGDDLLARGLTESAAREYIRALKLLSGAPNAPLLACYHRLGRANDELGRTFSAVQWYRKALEIDSKHLASLRAMIKLHADWGEWDTVRELEADLLDALSGRPEQHGALIASGDMWLAAANPALAKWRYAQALNAFPDSRVARNRLATVAAAG